MAPRDRWDADLSALLLAVESIGPLLAIWEARREPDAHARRAANDAMDSVDAALAALYRLRAELVTQIRRADDQAAARVDALLGTGLAPPGRECGGGPHDAPANRPATTAPLPNAEADSSISRGGDSGRAPRQEAP